MIIDHYQVMEDVMVVDDELGHIRRASRRFGLLFQVLVVLVPLLNLLFWVSFNDLPPSFLANLPVSPTGSLPAPILVAGFMASLLPIGVMVFGLMTLRTLFRLYEDGIIFSAANVRCFRRLGYAFIAWVLANVIYTPVLSIIITAINPPGEKALVVQFGSPQLSALVIGGIILLIAWVMDEGRKLKDEQAHTV